MYTKFYNFSEKPFNLTPDPKFLYLTPKHQEALASMIYGINDRKGFISITGEVGTGKTTLIYTLLNNLNEKVKTVFVYHTNITFEQLLKNILIELDVPTGDEDKVSLLYKLNEYVIQRLSQQETLAIIIDEAQNLPKEVMEELRMLSNLETSKSKLLQIVLVGQPELEAKLNSEGLRQLKQRIGIRRQIRPLSQEDSRKYIEHRLNVVGSSSSRVFTSKAISLICRYAGGIPRTINIICDNGLLIGYGESKKKVDANIIKEVIKDMESLIVEPIKLQAKDVKVYPSVPKTRPLYNKVAVSILLIFCLGLVAFLGREYLQDRLPKLSDIKYFKNLGIVKPSSNPNSSSEPSSTSKDNLIVSHNKTDDINTLFTELETPAPEPLQGVSSSPTPFSTSKKESNVKQIITVKKGDTVFYLAQKCYGLANETLADFIMKANPEITNVHIIKVNQQIKIPEITEKSLLIKSPDNTYKINAGTFDKPYYIKLYHSEPALRGRDIDIIPLKVSYTDTWYRVMLGKFEKRDEALETIAVLRQKRLLPCFADVSEPTANRELP